MKTTNEILAMLIEELVTYYDNFKMLKPISEYYNENLGDISFLLAGLLESSLKANQKDWDTKKWIDDSLISEIIIENDILILEGVMIWGKTDTTQQWTEPFKFELKSLRKNGDFKAAIFYFGDSNLNELDYNEFMFNRKYWCGLEKKWKYKLKFENLQYT